MTLSASTSRQFVLTREQVRDVDRRAIDDYGISGLVLMENAGRNAAEALVSLGINGPVAICCGKGNNAGDGFVIARHLENSGFDVTVLLAAPPGSFSGDAAANFHILQRAGTRIIEPPADVASCGIASAWQAELARADWIIDALLGTGTSGIVREPFASAIAAINAALRKVLAVDLPSGLDCDNGEVLGICVKATHTATFVAKKPGFTVAGADEWTGEIHVLDIGVPSRLIQEIVASINPP